ncbi:kinase-like domain-containing protein [Nemania sp. NC0429]|nr:kinase-like domain-containing protein [Nemania sp. NC0429]
MAAERQHKSDNTHGSFPLELSSQEAGETTAIAMDMDGEEGCFTHHNTDPKKEPKGCFIPDEDLTLPFAPESLPAWATSIRNGLMNKNNNAEPVVCTNVLSFLCGSNNVVFPLVFSDGVTWALKVPQGPACQSVFTPANAHSITTEVLTLRLLKKETTIPVPVVHDYCASMRNSLLYPYILMDYMDGLPSFRTWFPEEPVDPNVLETRRMNTLNDLADIAVQLSKFTSTRGGWPIFDSEGQISDVGIQRKFDQEIAFADETGQSDSDALVSIGPFETAKSRFLAMLDRREVPADDVYSTGTYKLLHMFIDWASELEDFETGEFVLTHYDFALQNVLVTEEGRVCGIIDWEDVGFAPACVGNLSYPEFLTPDLDPDYSYDPENKNQNSPEELKRFRVVYSDMIEKKLFEATGTVGGSTRTRKSPLFMDLQFAADYLSRTHVTMIKLWEQMTDLMGKQLIVNGQVLDDGEIAWGLAEGELDEATIELVKGRFMDFYNSL